MKNINAYTEANEEFNKAVENLMNEGWKINTGSMNGTQGEVALSGCFTTFSVIITFLIYCNASRSC